jgi:hypothetical protein
MWAESSLPSMCRRCSYGGFELTTKTCTICFDEAALVVGCKSIRQESFSSVACNHKYCKECISRHVTTRLDEGVWNIRCPGENCKYFFGPQDIGRFVSAAYAERFDVLRNADYSQHLRDVLSDPTNDFSQWAKKNTQACPVCHVIVERTEGCNSMACKCGTVFCYQCGGSTCVCQLRVPEERLAFWHLQSGIIPAAPSTDAPAAPSPQHGQEFDVPARRIQALFRGARERRRVSRWRETDASTWLAAVDRVHTYCAAELAADTTAEVAVLRRASSSPDLHVCTSKADVASVAQPVVHDLASTTFLGRVRRTLSFGWVVST